MNIEQIKAQVAEWERLDKERTQGEWWVPKKTSLFHGMPVFEVQFGGDGECIAEIVHAEQDAAFIAQAPAMFQAVKQLMAENERLEKELQIQDYANEILETENKRLKTTLKGTQTVLAGTMMAFADK